MPVWLTMQYNTIVYFFYMTETYSIPFSTTALFVPSLFGYFFLFENITVCKNKPTL